MTPSVAGFTIEIALPRPVANRFSASLYVFNALEILSEARFRSSKLRLILSQRFRSSETPQRSLKSSGTGGQSDERTDGNV
jgi:hypothetical protein